MVSEKISSKFAKYHFEIKHITIFFAVLILFQIVMVFVQKASLQSSLSQTQNWYKKYSAEKLAVVTSTSMELLFENLYLNNNVHKFDDAKIIYSFNVIFKQQLIQRTVKEIFLILIKNRRMYIIDSGQKLDLYLKGELAPYDAMNNTEHAEAVNRFLLIRDQLKSSEVINSSVVNNQTFNVYVPFVPNGEYWGVMYLKIVPDLSFFTDEISDNFDRISLIYSSLIFLGLIAIFYVSSKAVEERNEAQEKLFEEHKENYKKEIRFEKESLFTKRIYHTHHKTEKIMGFIKEDVRRLSPENLNESKARIITYSNFISRIIYDMKWFDQEINTIINPMFHTDINLVIHFIIEHVFLRISSRNDMFSFKLDLDSSLPFVHVNEFVVWEILEPIIQNSIDHGNKRRINILIATKYTAETNISTITVSDDGVGIREDLLAIMPNGIKKLFLENETTKLNEGATSGYGCFIAHQMAVGKCGWELEAENTEPTGCKFIITIKN